MCPSSNEKRSKMWYTYIREYDPAMKRNKILGYARICNNMMSLKNILSERSQIQKTIFIILLV